MRIVLTSQKSKFITVFQLTKTSIKDVAEGTEVKFKVVEKQPKSNASNKIINVQPVVNMNTSENENIVEHNDNTNNLTLPDIKESALEKSTNSVTRRNSALSRRRSRDISAKESASKTTEKTNNTLPKGSLAGSRNKSASRESLNERTTQRSSSRAANPKRLDSATITSRQSARSDKRETRIMNNTPRSSVTRKNSIA
jgi:hypothetical protein